MQNSIETTPPTCRLSICIGTFNRADFIGATLESILTQVTSNCEVVVSDNASSDSTQQVVAQYAARFPYVRQEANIGLDRYFNAAVTMPPNLPPGNVPNSARRAANFGPIKPPGAAVPRRPRREAMS